MIHIKHIVVMDNETCMAKSILKQVAYTSIIVLYYVTDTNGLFPFLSTGAAWDSKASSVTSASGILDVNMEPAFSPGSATAKRGGEACFVTKVSSYNQKTSL